MKRTVITLLILTLLFSACSGSGPSSESDSQNTSETTEDNSNANDTSTTESTSDSDSDTSESEPAAVQQFTLRGNLFYDENNNGSLDSGESGISEINIMINNDWVTTDSDGIYQFTTSDVDITIKVDQTTLPANYTTTTNNEEQLITLTADNEEAAPIGYIDLTTQGYEFRDVFNADKSYDNYYTELIMVSAGVTYNTKMWVSGNSMKFETDTTITCMNGANSYNYVKAENMAIVAPIEDIEQIPTPFTTTDEIDEESFSEIYFVRMDDLDGKDVYVFEHSAPSFKATYYVWKEEGIILKMELDDGTGIYFRDLQFGLVTEEDFALPEGAEVFDMNSMMDTIPSP